MSDLTSRMAAALREAHTHLNGRGRLSAVGELLDRIDALLAEHDAQPERGEDENTPEAAEENAAMVILGTVANSLPGNVHDDFLEWYEPSKWFGIHRAVGGFLAKRVQDALAAAPGAGEGR